jgi:hypothetical protein
MKHKPDEAENFRCEASIASSVTYPGGSQPKNLRNLNDIDLD